MSTISSHTLTYQGYVEFEPKLRFSQVKKISFLSRAHVEKRGGSAEQARVYACKNDTRIEGPWSIGGMSIIPARIGKRGKLDEIVDLIVKEGKSSTDILALYPGVYLQYQKSILQLEARQQKKSIPYWRSVYVMVLYGPTGTGKTRKALELAGEDRYVMTKGNSSNIWVDNYDFQHTLVMDEFYGGWMPYQMLLRLLDGHPFEPECKGGRTVAAWNKIIITSHTHPSVWYKRPECDELLRRINEIALVSEPIYPVSDPTSRPVEWASFPLRGVAVPNFPIFDRPAVHDSPTQPMSPDVLGDDDYDTNGSPMVHYDTDDDLPFGR